MFNKYTIIYLLNLYLYYKHNDIFNKYMYIINIIINLIDI